MTDLTVLVSPIPLYPSGTTASDFTFGMGRTKKKQPGLVPRPIMVTLEKEIEADADSASDASPDGLGEEDSQKSRRLRYRHTTTAIVDPDLLSPPVNTFRASSSSRQTRTTRHRSTRSRSAPPPERRNNNPQAQEFDEREPRTAESDSKQGSSEGSIAQAPLRRATARTPSSSSFGNSSSSFIGRPSGPGELVRPPPPLFRPTTFWRKTRRSGVTSASYSPSSYLIRRSTYIAAGLKFDKPIHDLSALCVESRVERVVCKATNEEWI